MKRSVITLLLTLVSMAVAQGGEEPTGINRYLDAEAWLGNLQATTALYTTGIWSWAGALTALGCVVSIIFTMLRGSVMGYLDFISRLMVVMLIFGSVGTLTKLNFWLWNELRQWSMQEVTATFDKSAPELERLGADSAILLTALGAPAALKASAEASSMVAAKAGAQEMSTYISRFLNAAIVPILGFIVISYLIILLSGLLIAFANVILPISTAMLMFGAETGTKWLGAYFGSVLTSLFIVAFMPTAFNAAFSFTVVQPVKTLNENFKTAGDVWNEYRSGTVPQELVDLQNEIAVLEAQRAETAKNAGLNSIFQSIDAAVQRFNDTINAKAAELSAKSRAFFEDQWQQILFLGEVTLLGARNMVMRMALFFIGTLVGLYFIISSARAISGLIGGVGLSVAGALARPLSAVGLGPAGGGGGRGPTPSLPATTGAGRGALATTGAGAGFTGYTEGPSSGGGRSVTAAPIPLEGGRTSTIPPLEGSHSATAAPSTDSPEKSRT